MSKDTEWKVALQVPDVESIFGPGLSIGYPLQDRSEGIGEEEGKEKFDYFKIR